MKRIIFVWIGIFFLLAGSYFGWALHRVSREVVMKEAEIWPRPWPYPDWWLGKLERWFDKRYPAPPGMVKIEPEFDAVRITVLYLMAGTMVIGIGCFVPAGIELIKKRRRRMLKQKA